MLNIVKYNERTPLSKSSKMADKKNMAITFIVTEQCNLSCKYCYMIGKNAYSVMSFDTAKKAVDYFLDTYGDYDRLTLDFLGGEPFLEIDLIDKICDYFKKQIYIRNLKCFDNYGITLTTNGLLYNNDKVQKFIKKNLSKLDIGISLDGNKEKHDMQRVKKDGSGSYDDVIKCIPLWIKQFPNAQVKVTFASNDLIYLKDSIIHIWNLGIKNVFANVVYEDVWKDGDDEIFEKQMKELADYILENNLWKDYKCELFSEDIGQPIDTKNPNKNWCSSGCGMLAVDHNGDIYPCVRFMKYSLESKKPRVIGNIYEGINYELLRPFQALEYSAQSPKECIDCLVARGCGWCQGFNYDCSDNGSIYNRSIFVCKMHKARCRANRYFYTKLKNQFNYNCKMQSINGKYIYFLLHDNSISFCNYENGIENINQSMSLENFKLGINFAEKNFYTPVIVHNDSILTEEFESILSGMNVIHIVPNSRRDYKDENCIIVHDKINGTNTSNTCVLKINRNIMANEYESIIEVIHSSHRINIVIDDVMDFKDNDYEHYERFLNNLSEEVFNEIKNNNIKLINVLTDIMMLNKMNNCNAGISTFTLAPNGNVYACPAFYYADKRNNSLGEIGNISSDLHRDSLLELKKSPICSICDSYHCKRCVYQNKAYTKEYNIPTSRQCRISHIERKASMQLQKRILDDMSINENIKKLYSQNKISEIDYTDPIEALIKKKDL